MDKESGLLALRTVISSEIASRSSIAKELGIDPSQVSRIAAGKFRRMSGHALDVCKFALALQAAEHARTSQPSLIANIDRKVAKLTALSPNAAIALDTMLSALIEELTLNR